MDSTRTSVITATSTWQSLIRLIGVSTNLISWTEYPIKTFTPNFEQMTRGQVVGRPAGGKFVATGIWAYPDIQGLIMTSYP
jgi:hypothetical protein